MDAENFQGLGYDLQQNILFQDNTSTILLEKTVQVILGKRNCTVYAHYFVVKDFVDIGEL